MNQSHLHTVHSVTGTGLHFLSSILKAHIFCSWSLAYIGSMLFILRCSNNSTGVTFKLPTNRVCFMSDSSIKRIREVWQKINVRGCYSAIWLCLRKCLEFIKNSFTWMTTMQPLYKLLKQAPKTRDTKQNVEPLACPLRASPNFSIYPTKLRKPHAAHKAVIGLLTTSFPELHFRFHAR